MSWYIDVYGSSGSKSGSGPITSAAKWKSTTRMDKGGEFSFEAPLADAKVQAVAALSIVRCMALVGSTWREVGAGIVERIERRVNADGSVTAIISGTDLVGLLATLTVRTRYVGGGTSVANPQAAVTHAAALEVLEAVTADAPTGRWEFVPDGAPAVDALVGGWNYETLLQALIMLADKCGNHFYYSDTDQITFTAGYSDSGVRAVAATGELSSTLAAIAAISAISEIEDGAEIVSYLLPFGGGNADARLTINATTQTAATGYVFEDLTIYSSPATTVRAIVRSGATQTRQQARVWNSITPVSSSAADIQAAADALYYQAIRYMQQRAQAETFYRLTLASCPVVLRPTQTVRVSYRDSAQGIAIEDDLIVLEATTECAADGPVTTACVVSTVDRWPDSDVETLVQRLAAGQLYQVAPQLNANSYVIAYEKPVDDVETATFRFRFDSEVVQLTRVTFDFQLQPLESTVKSVAGSSSTTAAGGATTSSSGGATTSSSGGGATVTSGSGGGTTVSSTAGGGTTATSSSGGSATPTSSSGGSTTVTSDSGSGHTHEINVANSTTGNAVYYAGIGGTGDFRTDGGGKVNTSSTGSGHTHSVTIGNHTHTVTIDAHTHSITLNDHSHNVTLNDHTHSVTISAHTHTVGNHTHTIGDHTHTFTAAIATTYGIFRDSSANTFGLTDIEYSVDGSTWYAFSVGVNGFTNLGDGWYRVDLTALLQDATTLRPNNSNNALRVRKKAAGAAKKASIEAQLNIRTIIQAIAAI